MIKTKGQVYLTKLQFIYFYAVFLFFVVEIGALMGVSIVKDAPSPPTIPPQPTVWDYLTWPIANIGYFFQLMLVSSDFFLFGALVLTPFIIGLIWIAIETMRGSGA